MDFFTVSSLSSRKAADLFIVPFWKGKKHPEVAVDVGSVRSLLSEPLSTDDFHGNEGEVLIHYASGQPEKRVALLGLGKEADLTIEKLRRAYAQITKACGKKKLTSVNLMLPECSIAEIEVVRGVCEGLLLPNYAFSSLKHDALKEGSPVLLEKATLIGATQRELALAKKCATICDSVYFARDLINGNADDVTPQHLTAVARGLEKTCKHVRTTIFDKKRIEKEKMGLLLAVNRGSFRDPAFIIVEYQGKPKSPRSGRQHRR